MDNKPRFKPGDLVCTNIDKINQTFLNTKIEACLVLEVLPPQLVYAILSTNQKKKDKIQTYMYKLLKKDKIVLEMENDLHVF